VYFLQKPQKNSGPLLHAERPDAMYIHRPNLVVVKDTGDRIWMERNKRIGMVNDTTKHFKIIQVGKIKKKYKNENFE